MTGIAAEICAPCGNISLEQRGFCNRCGSRDVELGMIAGEGSLWSQSVIHRPPSTEGGVAEPYVIGLIALQAGPRVMAVIPQGLAIGDPLTVARATMSDALVATRHP